MRRTALDTMALRVQLSAFPGPVLPAPVARLLEDGLGGVCLFPSNTAGGPERVRRLTASVHGASPYAVVAVDEEGGDVTRLHTATGSPAPGCAVLGAVDDVEATRATGYAIGGELAAVGIDLDLAPVADVNSNPANPIIGVRSFGSDPRLVARHVAAWTEGLQRAGVAACAKHFPGHGDTALDSHTALPSVDAPVDVLAARELVPFEAAVAAGTAAVMTSHVLLPALDPRLPATLSPVVLALLRERLGFAGLIVTDALDMDAVADRRGIPRAAVLSLVAGADLLCLGAEKDADLVEAVRAEVVAAVRSGELAEERLAEAADRVEALGARKAGAAPPRLDERAQPGAAGAAGPADPVALAARALRVEPAGCDLPDLSGALVVSVRTQPSRAVGEVPWGLEPDLDVRPDVAAVPAVLAAARGRPLFVQVRDLHRHVPVEDLLEQLLAARPDLVVVEVGWPAPTRLPVPRICTYGASLVTRRALEQLLASPAH